MPLPALPVLSARLPLRPLALALALPLVGVGACTSHVAAPTDPVASEAASPRVLAIGEGTTLGDDYQLQFVDVSGDSRCPQGVQCVWEGEALVVLGPSHPTMRFRPDTLRLRGGAPDSMDVGPFRVTVTRLDPYPVADRPIARGAYRATLAVRRR